MSCAVTYRHGSKAGSESSSAKEHVDGRQGTPMTNGHLGEQVHIQPQEVLQHHKIKHEANLLVPHMNIQWWACLNSRAE